MTVKLGLTRDARLVACQTRIVYNSGAYAAFKPSETVGLRGAEKGAGPYDIPNVQIDAYQVYTNTVPCGHMRSPGRAADVFAVESLVDMICRQLGSIPCIPPQERHQGRRALARRRALPRRAGARRRCAAVRRSLGLGAVPKRARMSGRGVAIATSTRTAACYHAELTVEADGTVGIITAIPEVGTGAHTVLKQIVAERLGRAAGRGGATRRRHDGFPYDRGVGRQPHHPDGRRRLLMRRGQRAERADE